MAQMLKHYNDAVFYKHAIRNTTDDAKKEIRETRLDVAIQESRACAQPFRPVIFFVSDKYIIANTYQQEE